MVNSADWLHLDTFSPMRDDIPRCIRLLNTWKTGFAIKASQCSGHLYWIKAVLTGFMGGLVFWWSQSGLYATAVGSESVYSRCDPVTGPEHWIAVTVKPFFPGVERHLVLGRASSTGGKVFRSSQSALCTNFRLQWGRYRVNYPQSSS